MEIKSISGISYSFPLYGKKNMYYKKNILPHHLKLIIFIFAVLQRYRI